MRTVSIKLIEHQTLLPLHRARSGFVKLRDSPS